MLSTRTCRTVSLAMAFTAILGLALPASADPARPFKGHADAVVTAAEPVPDGQLLTVVAKGWATHLGRFTRKESVVLHKDFTLVGTLVFTDANGDELFADVEGAFVSETTAVGTYTFTGGTGRFTNASGRAAFEGVTPDLVHVTLTFEGAISLRP